MAEIKDKDRIIESLQSKLASIQVDGMFENAKEVNGGLQLPLCFPVQAAQDCVCAIK